MNDQNDAPMPDDELRAPQQFFSSHSGMRMFSVGALVERVIAQFVREHADNSAALLEAQTRVDKLKLLRETMQYVIAVESLVLAQDEQADVMRQAYSELFAYGPLDDLLGDEDITTISLEGWQKVSIRRVEGELHAIDPLFEDYEQMQRIAARLLRNAGAEMREDTPYIETGVIIEGRRVSVNMMAPPVVPLVSVVLRLHPRILPPLESLVVNEQARMLLTQIARSEHGFVVVGESEAGKTTLLSMLASLAPLGDRCIAVERAGEMHLSESVTRLTPQWSTDDEQRKTFGDQIQAAMAREPRVILLDEVRADEPRAIVPLLTAEQPPRMMWAFRGTANPKRLASALGMLARMGDPTKSEALVRALYERLPFVITVRRRAGRIELSGVAEWQFAFNADYPDFVELMTQGWEGLEMTGKPAGRALGLPDDFWSR